MLFRSASHSVGPLSVLKLIENKMVARGAGDMAGRRRQDGEADGGADRAGGAVHQHCAGP